MAASIGFVFLETVPIVRKSINKHAIPKIIPCD
jgi:hypothetical protein